MGDWERLKLVYPFDFAALCRFPTGRHPTSTVLELCDSLLGKPLLIRCTSVSLDLDPLANDPG